MTEDLKARLTESLAGIITDEDYRRGFKDVHVTDKLGTAHTVRVTRCLGSKLSEKVLFRYCSSGNVLDLIRPFVSKKEHTAEEFLNLLTPGDLCRLSNTVAALVLGKKAVENAMITGLRIL